MECGESGGWGREGALYSPLTRLLIPTNVVQCIEFKYLHAHGFSDQKKGEGQSKDTI